MNALRIVNAGREQVDQKHMDAVLKRGFDFADELRDVLVAVLVRRRDHFHQGHEAVAADVPHREGLPP
jgi:hypothetical protein